MSAGDRVRVTDERSRWHERRGTILEPTDSGFIVRIDDEPFPLFFLRRQVERIEEETR